MSLARARKCRQRTGLQPLGIVPRKPRKIVPIAVALLQLLAQVLEADVVKDHANGRSRGYHHAPLGFKALAEICKN